MSKNNLLPWLLQNHERWFHFQTAIYSSKPHSDKFLFDSNDSSWFFAYVDDKLKNFDEFFPNFPVFQIEIWYKMIEET